MTIATDTTYTTRPADDIWHGVDYIAVYTRARPSKTACWWTAAPATSPMFPASTTSTPSP